MADKKPIYQNIKIAGIVCWIPFILISGPVAGFFAGEFLKERFGLSSGWSTALICLGALSGFMETARMIRWLIKLESKKQ
ncbi:MAG: hypothetical protein HQL23_02395 [Candidatus Omnitrophica bacterium]|nr:hypothetical protein [Candidatus Omnitrophota bacterium]